MQIRHFHAEGVHGYLNFDIMPKEKITFLHGVNGTGKTTAIRSIVALLNFELMWLCKTHFHKMLLFTSHKGSDIIIRAERSSHKLFLHAGTPSRPDEYTLELDTPPIAMLYRDETERLISDDFILRQIKAGSDQNYFRVAEFFRKLPKPLYMGLDRTSEITNDREARPSRVERHSKGASNSSIDTSLPSAEEAAREAYLNYQTRRQEGAATIRGKIPLILFRPKTQRENLSFPGIGKRAVQKKLRTIKTLRASVVSSYASLPDQTPGIMDQIDQYFNDLSRLLNDAQDYEMKTFFNDPDKLQVVIDLNRYEASLPFIQEFGDLLKDYEIAQINSYRPLADYLDTLNGFILDSGKEIFFHPDGKLGLKLPSGRHGDVRQLSSGEKQLFILITQLAFRARGGGRDILIIDEPELSLHIAWQMQFVDAIQRVAPNTQIILATHSPSIILDREEFCVALSA